MVVVRLIRRLLRRLLRRLIRRLLRRLIRRLVLRLLHLQQLYIPLAQRLALIQRQVQVAQPYRVFHRLLHRLLHRLFRLFRLLGPPR